MESIIKDFGIAYKNNIITITNSNNIVFNINIKITGTKLTFINQDQSVNNIILFNVLNLDTIEITELYDILGPIKEVAENIYMYCIGCYNKVDFQADTFVTCGSESCVNKYEELQIGNPVSECIKKDTTLFSFLVDSGFQAIQSNRNKNIFEPFPPHFLNKKNVKNIKRGEMSKLKGIDYDDQKDFNKLLPLAKKPVKELVIENKNDISLCKLWSIDLYLLVRFIITSCKVDINYDFTLTENVPNLDNSNFKIYRLLHPVTTEEEFTKRKGDKQTYYLFHGSKSENWYSIIRNGLKNCSNTKLMTCGAAHGSGIYFSNDSNFSYSYGSSSKGESYLGVFEIIGHKNDYLKSPNIYVIDNEKIVIQRYLIIAKKQCSNNMAIINNIFDKVIHEKKVHMIAGVMNKGFKKLVREYRLIKKIPEQQFGFRIVVSPDNLYLWKLYLFDYDKNDVIAKDMEKYNIKEIDMQVNYPPNYPFSPPFIRIISPRFKHLTGHVTREGALCMQILTEKHWDPACSMESLIITIKSEILAGGGQIDPVNYKIPYSEQLAKESFVMVAKSHGWL